jgi:hypothetical protein
VKITSLSLLSFGKFKNKTFEIHPDIHVFFMVIMKPVKPPSSILLKECFMGFMTRLKKDEELSVFMTATFHLMAFIKGVRT